MCIDAQKMPLRSGDEESLENKTCGQRAQFKYKHNVQLKMNQLFALRIFIGFLKER